MKGRFTNLLFVGFFVFGNAYAQDTLITKTWKNSAIGSVKEEITRQTNFIFWDTIPEKYFFVTLSVKNWPLRKVLDTIFRTHGFTWDIFGNAISIKKQEREREREQEQKKFTLTGRIVNHENEAIGYATITIKGTLKSKPCDENGYFSIETIKEEFTIVISMAGYIGQERQIRGEDFVTIKLEPNISNLQEVSVSPPSKTPAVQDTFSVNISNIKTGSTFVLDNSLVHRAVSQNISDLFPVLTGVILNNPNASPVLNQSPISIRNRITIYGYPHTLVVLNGFPYFGDLSNINPNDVESITIMKDAAATARWGVQAGNGVIMITTRNGAMNTPPKITATVNITVGQKPDLFHLHSMPADAHVDITKMLYQNGHYKAILQNMPSAIIPPAAEILYRKERGLLTEAAAAEALNNLRKTDVREEALKYLYRRSLHQQYHVGMRGGGRKLHYYFSLGYDINKSTLTGNDNNRFTMNLNNTITLGKQAPEIHFSLYLSQSTIYKNGFDIRDLLYPNEKLADEHGNPLPVTQTVRQGYKDSTATGILLDWNYRPLDEIKQRNNKLINNTFLFTTVIKHKIGKKLEANLSYRYEKVINEQKDEHSLQTYFTCDLINRYTQMNAAGGVSRPIPLGDIQDENYRNRDAHYISAQLKYDLITKESNSLTFYIVPEVQHIQTRNKRLRNYGVTNDRPTTNIDFTTAFPMFYEPALTQTIPYINSPPDTTDYIYSFSTNAVYTWKKRITASFSISKDESNIFSAQANHKGVPLIAAGISWDISKERFYHSKLFSLFRLRLSNGFCGNVSRTFSALTGIRMVGTNPWASQYSTITNAPNPSLSPETVRISNIGLDFSLLNNRIWGSADYFVKEGTNLLGKAPIDPTTGISVFQGNVAAMKGHGIELALHTKFGAETLQWQSLLLMSFVRDKVTKYALAMPSIWYYCDPRFLNPKAGKPLYAVYSLDFRGLDPANGDPIGALDNRETKDYVAILQSPDFDNLIYHGPATPVFYGSFLNTITWKFLEFGFNIIWKAGHYFRRNSIKYEELFNGLSIGHADITQRWQAPGDERNTNIPSLQFPADYSRDQFFNYSSAVVEKGDHIRLQDIILKYNFKKKYSEKRIIPSAELYVYAKNIGLIWRANDKGIDPDFVNSMPVPFNITVGLKTHF